MNENSYVTPCQSICRINKTSRTCIGCGRTMEEIASWSSYTHDERMVIMRRLGYGTRRKRDRKKPLL